MNMLPEVSSLLDKIAYIKAMFTFNTNEEVICDGLSHAITRGELPAAFDLWLRKQNTLTIQGIIQDIDHDWDGQNYLSGVIATARQYYNEVLKELIG